MFLLFLGYGVGWEGRLFYSFAGDHTWNVGTWRDDDDVLDLGWVEEMGEIELPRARGAANFIYIKNLTKNSHFCVSRDVMSFFLLFLLLFFYYNSSNIQGPGSKSE